MSQISKATCRNSMAFALILAMAASYYIYHSVLACELLMEPGVVQFAGHSCNTHLLPLIASLPENDASSVQQLDLGSLNLQQVPPIVSKFSSLQVLFLSNNMINSTAAVSAINSMNSIRVLSLRSCQLSHIDLAHLPSALEQLILTDNLLSDIQTPWSHRRLRKIMLTRNMLTSLPPEFGHQKHVELLRLSENKLTALPDQLFSMSHLAWLALASNPVIEKGMTAMMTSHASDVVILDWSDIMLDSVLGQGTSGVVHAARYMGRTVAVKIFKAHSSDGSYYDEIRVASLLSHPFIVRVIGQVLETRTKGPALVMELLPRHRPIASPPDVWSTLRCRYPPSFYLSVEKVRKIALSVADALVYLHANKIIHGDVYAHNILISSDNDDERQVLLSDFGASWYYGHLSEINIKLVERIEVRAFGILLQPRPLFVTMCQELLARVTLWKDPEQTRLWNEIADLCLATHVEHRPSFRDLKTTLVKL